MLRTETIYFLIQAWLLDGTYLILKIWPDNKVLKEIPFDTTTLWLEIHGLPLVHIHEGTAKKIKNMVGYLHLQVRVDISLSNPILAGFTPLKDQTTTNSWSSSCMNDFCISISDVGTLIISLADIGLRT